MMLISVHRIILRAVIISKKQKGLPVKGGLKTKHEYGFATPLGEELSTA